MLCTPIWRAEMKLKCIPNFFRFLIRDCFSFLLSPAYLRESYLFVAGFRQEEKEASSIPQKNGVRERRPARYQRRTQRNGAPQRGGGRDLALLNPINQVSFCNCTCKGASPRKGGKNHPGPIRLLLIVGDAITLSRRRPAFVWAECCCYLAIIYPLRVPRQSYVQTGIKQNSSDRGRGACDE